MPHGLDCHKPRTNYGISADQSIGVVL